MFARVEVVGVGYHPVVPFTESLAVGGHVAPADIVPLLIDGAEVVIPKVLALALDYHVPAEIADVNTDVLVIELPFEYVDIFPGARLLDVYCKVMAAHGRAVAAVFYVRGLPLVGIPAFLIWHP